MKNKQFIFVLVLLVSPFLIYNFYKPSITNENLASVTPPEAPQISQFLFGAMDTWQDEQDNYADYDQLGFNFWHVYPRDDNTQITGRNTPKSPLASNDKLLVNVSDYASEVKTKINNIYSQHNSRLFLFRPKIDWLAYGQSSTYQCEKQLIVSN